MPLAMIEGLPEHAKEIFEKVMAATKGKYPDEKRGMIAWAAVKKSYKKVGDNWVAKSNALNISKNMRLTELCSPRILIAHMLAHDMSEKGKEGWAKGEIRKLHERLTKEMLKRGIDHKKKKCELDDNEPEEPEPEEDVDEDFLEFELSDYELRLGNELVEMLSKKEEKKKEEIKPEDKPCDKKEEIKN